MWDHTTDRMFLELRDDAVLLFGRQSLKLLYLNPAAQKLFPDAVPQDDFAALFQIHEVTELLNKALSNGPVHPLIMPQQPWFSGSAVLHAAAVTWNGEAAVAVTIDRRAYGPPPQAMELMRAVLQSAYFTALRIDVRMQNAGVISDKNVLMNTQAHFPSYSQYICMYSEATIHPDDRAQFLAAFSDEQIRLFMEVNNAPACTVRRICDEEYRWASFTLASADEGIVLLLGKDSNESHLQQEELEMVSLRNDYILSSISDIFRLMLHIDLTTGETVICSAINEQAERVSTDDVYAFQDIAARLIRMVHPADRGMFGDYLSLDALRRGVPGSEDNKITKEYRRIDPNGDPDATAKWTRSVLTFTAFDENRCPTEAVYTVQDIDAQKRQELESKRRQESLTSQFYTVIRSRYLWFVDCDFNSQTAHVFRIKDHTVLPPTECPFGQFFERIIMPNCHPEDYKRVALALLPSAVSENYRLGKRQSTIDYREKAADGWRYVRAEVYMQQDGQDGFRSMIYVSDIDDEVKSQIHMTQSEHEQLMLRRRIDSTIQDAFLYISEVDPDADVITHYQLTKDDQVSVTGTEQFTAFCSAYPDRFVFPEQRRLFRQLFSYDQILKAAREMKSELKHLFLIDPHENGTYIWCNFAVRFFRNENGKSYLMITVEDVNEVIEKRDADMQAASTAKEQLQEHMREIERGRIRSAHVFMNIFSSLQLALNRLYSNLDSLEAQRSAQYPSELYQMHQTYEQLSSMTECAKDMLLLDNNQLVLLNQPLSFLVLFRKLRHSIGKVFEEKHMQVISCAEHVTDETVLCDSERLTFLLDKIFFSIIRALPDGASMIMKLTQDPIPGQIKQAVYSFSLITRCRRTAENEQRATDPAKAIETDFLSYDPNYQPHNLYFCKRLIALMHGALDYEKTPDGTASVTLRLPLGFVRQQIIFPLRHTFGKHALVWDSCDPAAASTISMLRESGMETERRIDPEGTKDALMQAEAIGTPYDLIIVRASDLCGSPAAQMQELTGLTGSHPVFVIADHPALDLTAAQQFPTVRLIRTPVLRSTMAAALRQAFDQSE